MGAAFAVTMLAMVITWIIILLLLAFAEKPRQVLMADSRRITTDITGFTFKVLPLEENLAATISAILSFCKQARLKLELGQWYTRAQPKKSNGLYILAQIQSKFVQA